MNLKQAQAVLSDLLMKCEEEHVALPADPLETILEAIQALRANLTHELKRPLMDNALDHMKDKYGYKQDATPTQTQQKKRKHSTAGLSAHKLQDQQRYMRVPIPIVKAPPHPASTHSPAKKKSRLQDDIRAAPAIRQENQKLVDELVGLGEFELKSGRSQRGVTRLRAAKQIHDSSDVIKSGAQARRLEGIGASSAEKVDMLLHGGLRRAMKEYEDNADEEGGEEEEEERPEEPPSEEEVEHAAWRQEDPHKRDRQDAKLGANKPRAGNDREAVNKSATSGDEGSKATSKVAGGTGRRDADDEFLLAE